MTRTHIHDLEGAEDESRSQLRLHLGAARRTNIGVGWPGIGPAHRGSGDQGEQRPSKKGGRRAKGQGCVVNHNKKQSGRDDKP